ncbi:MAG: hypothetical protein HN350_05815 [Phycisphaerales bacterium]|jgi:hypothetical protein|nr:hypothetical protein [Phycisphaerales bacterium]
MKLYKKWVIAFLAVNATIFALITAFMYIVDPLQYYRPITFYKPSYRYHERLAIPGIVRNHDFDAIIIGSSTSQNARPSKVDELFGVRCVKFAAAGASAKELSLFFEEAVERKKIKMVIQGLDLFAYAGPPDRLRTEYPHYLYQLTPSTFYKYFYDGYILKKTLTKIDWLTAFDSKTYAFDHDVFAADKITKKPSRRKLVGSFFNPDYNRTYCYVNFIRDSKENFRRNVVRIALKNPDTKFYFHFIPSSILDWVTRDRHGDLPQLFELRSFIAEECSKLENVRLYDFQADEDITHNLDIYFDISHYDPTINDLIISKIHADSHRTNPEKCKQANTEIRQQVETFKKEVLPTLKQK